MIDWLNEFYGSPETRAALTTAFGPVFRRYADDVWKAEGQKGTPPEPFVDGLVDAYVTHHLESSRIQLSEVVVGDKPFDELASRLDEWAEKRPGKVAENETVRTSNAIALEAMRSMGAKEKVWVTVGTCAFCKEMAGKRAALNEPFISADEEVTPDGEEPMRVRSNVGHPPLHRGCQCSIEPDQISEVSPETRPPAMVDFENGIREAKPKVEWGAVFDPDGKMLWSGRGKGRSVQIPLEFLQRGMQVTHLHPGAEGYMLSFADVALAIDKKLGVIRSFVVDGKWMEIRTGDYQFGSSRFVSLFKTAWRQEERQYKALAEQLTAAAASPTKELHARLDAEFAAAYGRALRSSTDTLGFDVREGTNA